MAVDQGLIELFTVTYKTNLEILLQQGFSKLRPYVSTDAGYVGKMVSPVNYVHPFKTKAAAGRFAVADITEATYQRRWVAPQAPQYLKPMIDKFDQLETLLDPKSSFMQNSAAAYGRWFDEILIAAATGPALIGQDASALGTETFSTTQFQIAANFDAGADTGLTVSKLSEVVRIFEHYENDLDMEQPCMVIGSKQHANLRAQAQVISSDFNGNKPVLDKGRVLEFMGIHFIRSERLPVVNGIRQCFAFMRSGLHLGIWQDVEYFIAQDNERVGRPWYVYSDAVAGATRLQPGKIIQVLCADTTGGPIVP